MKVSVEISTYNRKDVLEMVLARLAKQSYSLENVEVVISDDGSSDGTDRFIEQFKEQVPFHLHYARGDHQGVGATHNRGIRLATGDIVIMLADDILAVPELLEQHVRIHEANPEENVVVVGRLCQSGELPKTAFQRNWNPIAGRGPEGKSNLDYTDFWVSNISFKRTFMLENGMFRNWPAGSHEDLDLGYRLQRKGMKLIYNPEATGYHHHAETIESTSARAYMHGFNWYHVEKEIDDVRIRVKTGRVCFSDGLYIYGQTLLKHTLRRLFVNRFTAIGIAMPLVWKAEKMSFIEPFVPFLSGKILSYYFHKGYMDHKKGRDYNPNSAGK
ncbi:MAG: glycosyltransferase family 2 protein [Nitrospirota bacterium]|nr:glycosyltransferase family 2 protein [Nitrospirota bacterium]